MIYMYVARYEPGSILGKTEAMNDLDSILLVKGVIKGADDCGVQECSDATCVFEVHVIKKRV